MDTYTCYIKFDKDFKPERWPSNSKDGVGHVRIWPHGETGSNTCYISTNPNVAHNSWILLEGDHIYKFHTATNSQAVFEHHEDAVAWARHYGYKVEFVKPALLARTIDGKSVFTPKPEAKEVIKVPPMYEVAVVQQAIVQNGVITEPESIALPLQAVMAPDEKAAIIERVRNAKDLPPAHRIKVVVRGVA